MCGRVPVKLRTYITRASQNVWPAESIFNYCFAAECKGLNPDICSTPKYELAPCRNSTTAYVISLLLSNLLPRQYDSRFLTLRLLRNETSFDKCCRDVRLCHQKIVTCKTKRKLRGLSPQANYTDPATTACRRS
jgi:hypothetical protein